MKRLFKLVYYRLFGDNVTFVGIVCFVLAGMNISIWAQTEPCANPPRNLSGTYENNTTQLTWVAPEGLPDWLSWSTGVYDSNKSVGLAAGTTPFIAHIFEPEDLAGHGTLLTRIDFMLNAGVTAANDYGVYAYQPNGEGLLQVIAGQEVPDEDIKVGEWIEVVLDEPAIIDPTKALYVGYNCQQLQDEVYPFAFDNGTIADGKGNVFNAGEGWGTLSQSGIPGNWLIRALVEEADTDAPVAKRSLRAGKVLGIAAQSRSLSDQPQVRSANGQPGLAPALLIDREGNRHVLQGKTARNLRAGEADGTPEYPYYNVYRDGVLVGTTAQTSYQDPVCVDAATTFNYAVEYVAAEACVSGQVSTQVQAELQLVAPQLGHAELYEGQASPYCFYLSVAKALPCAKGYRVYLTSRFYENETPHDFGVQEDGTPHMAVAFYFVPGDTIDLAITALYDVNGVEMESPKNKLGYMYYTCLGGAPVIGTDPEWTYLRGKDVRINFSAEALMHYVERNGEILGQTLPGFNAYAGTIPEFGKTYTYRIGVDCEGTGNTETITWSEPWTVTAPECPTTYGEVYETYYRTYDGDFYHWEDFKEFYYESGDYTQTTTNAAGCDSIVTLHLTMVDRFPATVNFYGHKEGWSSMAAMDYAYWEDNQWKLLTDEELQYSGGYGSDCDREQYYEYSVQVREAAHRKVDNDSVIAFRLRGEYAPTEVYTEWIPLPAYGETRWYTAANLPGAKAFAIDADDKDHHRYYASLEGLAGDELRDELHRLLNDGKQVVRYSDLPTVYTVTDWWEVLDADGYATDNGIWDMYSDYRPAGWGVAADPNGSEEGRATINREHALPKSWWGHDKYNPIDAYSDIVHVIPTNTVVNAMRGAYPYSEIASPTQTSENGSKAGTSTYPGYSLNAFEPVDEYKGDLARIYFYMATCYADLDFTVSRYDDAGGVVFTYDGGKTGFTDFGRTLFMDWAEGDPVSSKEIIRNNGVQSVQGNRNPFVDLPGLEDYLWGDKQNCVFYFDHSGECITPPCKDLAFSASFNQSFDGFTAVDKLGYQNWYNPAGTDYITMNGYKSGASNPNEDWLVSPAFDLASMKNARLTFTHVINHCKDAERLVNNHTLWITSAYTGDPATTVWTQLDIPVMPTGVDWSWVTPTVDLPAEYLTDDVRFAFKYLSDDQMSGQWEIKNLSLTATCADDGPTVGVDTPQQADEPLLYTLGRTIHVDGVLAGADVSVYDLTGRSFGTYPSAGGRMQFPVPTDGMYIVTISDKAYKVVVK